MYRLVGSAAAVRPISRLVGSSVAGVANTPVRCFSDMDAPKSVFDRAVKVAHRERAATARRVAGSEPLAAEVTMRLLDRLEDIKGREFPVAVTFGGAGRQVLEQLADGRAGVKHLHMFDSSAATIREAQECAADLATRGVQVPELTCALADEEHLPLQNASVDVIITSLGLHWVNNIPGLMAQCRRALKPDGLFLASFLGGQTLQEFRIACSVAELEREGGLSPRMSPLAEMRDAGNLLGAGGFALPSVDTDEIEMKYTDVLDLVQHLRMMGESNAVLHRRPTLHRDTALAAAAVYQSFEQTEDPEETDDGITATFQIIYMAGWAPDASQQKPAARGSATSSFGDLDKAMSDIGDVYDAEDMADGKIPKSE